MMFSTLYRGSLDKLADLERSHYGPPPTQETDAQQLNILPVPRTKPDLASALGPYRPSLPISAPSSTNTNALLPPNTEAEPVWRRPFHNGFGLSPGMFNGLFTAPGTGEAAIPSRGATPSSSHPQLSAQNQLGLHGPAVYNPNEGRQRLAALARSMAQTPIPSGGFPRGQHPLQSPAVQALPLQQRAFLQTEFFKEQNRLVQNGAQQQQITKADQSKRAARVEQDQAIAVGQKYKARKALDAEIDRLNLNLAYTSTGAQPMGQEDRITLLTQIQNLENNRWRFEANNDWEKALYQKMDALDRGVDAAGYGLAGGLVTKVLRPITAGSLGATGLNPGLGMSTNPGLNARLTPAPPSAPGNLSTLPGSSPGTSRALPPNPFSQQQLAKAARDLLDPHLYERDSEDEQSGDESKQNHTETDQSELSDEERYSSRLEKMKTDHEQNTNGNTLDYLFPEETTLSEFLIDEDSITVSRDEIHNIHGLKGPGLGSKTASTKGWVLFYRVMGENEFSNLLRDELFSLGKGATEAKYFSRTLDGLRAVQRQYYASRPHHIIETYIPFEDALKIETLGEIDGAGDAYVARLNTLQRMLFKEYK